MKTTYFTTSLIIACSLLLLMCLRSEQQTYELVTYSGDLEVWPIEASATSELGTSRMTAIFNDDLGFLEMNFVNIDSSKITFKLKEVNE
jgi:hypothetical protein